jgi:hypothetical protein
VENFNKQYSKTHPNNDFQVGTWVWLHEAWLDEQKWNKGAHRWTRPFIIHDRVIHKRKLKPYKLRELDGIVKQSMAALDRVKVFYYRPSHQTIKTCLHGDKSTHAASSQDNTDTSWHIPFDPSTLHDLI